MHLAILPVILQHLLYIWCHRFVRVANLVEAVRVPLLHELLDGYPRGLRDWHDRLAVPEVRALVKDGEGLSSAEGLI